MAGKKRCFSTVRALRRLDPKLLCEVLAKFPVYLAERGLALPAEPSAENLPYAAIKDACMAGDIEQELDDVLFYVSALGNKDGWDKVQKEAEHENRRLSFSTAGLSCADLAMKAWLHDWPRNKELLERSHARAKMHARSSYVYYPPMAGHGKQFRMPSREELDVFRQELAEYFVGEELGKGTSVVAYEFDMEIWFLIRYPGQLERHPAIDDEGNDDNHSFKPAEYDAVMFHRRYCDLRLNTNRAKEHKHYRIAFGHLLFNAPNVFDPHERIVWLEPLKGPCRGLFKCEDVKGLGAIAPIEISFACQGELGREVIWRAEPDCSLLDYGGHGDYVLPEDTHSVKYARFRYRLTNRTKWETVTVHTGKRLNYERDGDSGVIEEWLRRRKFIKDTLGLFKDA